MIEFIGQFFMALGLTFIFLGCLGLVRMPDVYCRLQAATKCVTLGTGSVLVSAIILSGSPATAAKAVICIVFLFLNSPTSAHALAKAADISGIKIWEKPGDEKIYPARPRPPLEPDKE